jgi:hypothetical protein
MRKNYELKLDELKKITGGVAETLVVVDLRSRVGKR